jgi:hypothetical protein
MNETTRQWTLFPPDHQASFPKRNIKRSDFGGASKIGKLSFPVLRVSCDYKQTTTNSVAFSPQANYTDWATATCQRKLVPTFADRRVSHGQRGEILHGR